MSDINPYEANGQPINTPLEQAYASLGGFFVPSTTEVMNHIHGVEDPFVDTPPAYEVVDSQSAEASDNGSDTTQPAGNALVRVEESVRRFRVRDDRAGQAISPDNAQAVLPPTACVFIAK
jgi:hypothetical protein